MDDVGVRKDDEFVVLRPQLHQVRHFVPAEAGKTTVVTGHIPTDNDVRLVIRLPLDLCIAIKNGIMIDFLAFL